MDKIPRILLVAAILSTALSGCSDGGTSPGSGRRDSPFEERAYTLVVQEAEREVRRTSAGDFPVPWAPGFTATRFDSTLLTVREGFDLPEAFLDRWREELTARLVEYRQAADDTIGDFGWVWLGSGEDSEEASSVKFERPLVFWPVQGDRIETTAPASVLKFDTTSLFDLRDQHKGKPEFEGSGIADLVCENIIRSDDSIVLDYRLRIYGQGVMRFFYLAGQEWLLTGEEQGVAGDREESCDFEVSRNGYREFSRDPSGKWDLVRDVFAETWHAQSTESDMFIHESTLDGPNAHYSLALSDLGSREDPPVRLFADVYDFGAAGDGITLDTRAINAAIEDCNEAGGGTVYFPPGVFLSGSIHMRSNVTLKIEDGAILRGTTNMSRYDPREPNPWSPYQDNSHSYFHRSLIWGENLENVAILGPGIIDGSDAFEPWPILNAPPPPPLGWILSTLLYQINEDLFPRGPKPVALKSCRNILIKDIKIQHAPDEAILITGCDFALIDGFTAREVRVDGIDPDGCTKVTIARCEIKSLDDAVAIKSGYALGVKKSCEDILVKNCLLSTFINALKIGTESIGDFRNIVFRDCLIHILPGFPSFAGISLISVDGGTIDGVTASGITMQNVNYPLFIRLGDRLRAPDNPTVGQIRNVNIENVTAAGGIGTGASSITAVAGRCVGENIKLEDIDVVCKGGQRSLYTYLPVPEIRESDGFYPDPPYILPGRPAAYGFFCRHVRGLEFQRVRLGFEIPDLRAALICEDVVGLVIEDLETEHAHHGAPSVILR